MKDTNELRSIVDNYSLDLSSLLTEDLFRHFSITIPETTVSVMVVIEHLQEKIKYSFKTDGKQIKRQCIELIRQLLFENVLESKPVDPYMDILQRLDDNLPNDPEMPGEDDNWTQAIHASIDLNMIDRSLSMHDIQSRRYFFSREFALAEAAERMNNRGYHIDIYGSSPFMPDADMENVIHM